MEQYLALFTDSVANFGVWFVVVFLFIENVPLIGLFAPGLTILVLSGFFYEIITGSWQKLFIIAWLTVFIADTTWYWIGYFGQQKLAFFARIATRSPNIEVLLRTQPLYMFITYQFIPYFRMFLPFALGMYRFPFYTWVPICLVASALYTGVFLGIGIFGVIVIQEISSVDSLTGVLSTLLVMGAIIYSVILLRKYLRLKK